MAKVGKRNLTTIMYTLRRIHEATADVRQKKKQEEEDQSTDPFTRVKKQVANDIRECKDLIALRDDLYGRKGDDALVAKKSAEIRSKLSTIEDQAEALEKIQQKTAKKYSKKKNLSDEQQSTLDKQKAVVELTWQLIKECHNLEQFRGGERANVYDSDEDSLYGEDERSDGLPGGVTSKKIVVALPSVPGDQKFEELHIQDENINKGLEEIEKGLQVLLEYAKGFQEEIERQDELINTMDYKTDHALESLNNVNKQLKSALEKVRKGRSFCCDLILFLILVGVGIGIYSLVN